MTEWSDITLLLQGLKGNVNTLSEQCVFSVPLAQSKDMCMKLDRCCRTALIMYIHGQGCRFRWKNEGHNKVRGSSTSQTGLTDWILKAGWTTYLYTQHWVSMFTFMFHIWAVCMVIHSEQISKQTCVDPCSYADKAIFTRAEMISQLINYSIDNKKGKLATIITDFSSETTEIMPNVL